MKAASFAAPAHLVHPTNTLIICLLEDEVKLSFAEPMLRIPNAPTEMTIDSSFARQYADAITSNAELHDGAILASWRDPTYAIIGWSYRLYPPPIRRSPPPNRGSAFHSSLAMSGVPGVEAVILFTRGEQLILIDAEVKRLHSLTNSAQLRQI